MFEKPSSLPPPSSLLIATRNRGKVREMMELLSGLPVRLRNLDEFPQIGEVEETGQTFVENALLKARAYAAGSGLWTLADDSGLEVDALGGAPGVFSARYAGPEASDERRVERLLEELEERGAEEPESRRARFVCVAALVHPEQASAEIFTGTCEGHIAHSPRSSQGFGYDPVFVPEGYAQTFGELPSDIKQSVSHRARALAQVQEFLRARLTDSP